MYKNYKEDPSTLVPEDQFMMKVINDMSAIDELVSFSLMSLQLTLAESNLQGKSIFIQTTSVTDLS